MSKSSVLYLAVFVDNASDLVSSQDLSFASFFIVAVNDL